MENKKPTQFLMKPKVDFCFKELMEDEEVRNAFLAAVLGINLKEINESKILPSHLRQKDKDDKLGILNFIMFDDEEYYCRFHFWSDKGRTLYSDKFEIHTLELPKLAKHDYPETELLKWLQFINAETEEEFEMAAEKSEYIKKAYRLLWSCFRKWNWKKKCYVEKFRKSFTFLHRKQHRKWKNIGSRVNGRLGIST